MMCLRKGSLRGMRLTCLEKETMGNVWGEQCFGHVEIAAVKPLGRE